MSLSCVFCCKPVLDSTGRSCSTGRDHQNKKSPRISRTQRRLPDDNNDDIRDQVPSSVDAELTSFFIVRRLLRLEDAVCRRLLGEWGRPEYWGADLLCSSCEPLLQEAREIHKEIGILERQLLQLKAQVETKIVLSDATSATTSAEGMTSKRKRSSIKKGGRGVDNAAKFIREAVLERCKVTGGEGESYPVLDVDLSTVKVQRDDDGESDAGSFCFYSTLSDDDDFDESKAKREVSEQEDGEWNLRGISLNDVSSSERSTRSGRVSRPSIKMKEASKTINISDADESPERPPKRIKVEDESPNASAKRMASFLKSTLILKQSTPSPSQLKSRSSILPTSPSKEGTKSKSGVSYNKVSSPGVSTTQQKVDPETQRTENNNDGQNNLGLQVDKLCEELEKEIAKLSEQSATGSKGGADEITENVIVPKTPSGNSRVKKIDYNESDEDIPGPLDDDDYVPTNSDFDDDHDVSEKDVTSKTTDSDTKCAVPSSNTDAPVAPTPKKKRVNKPRQPPLLFRCRECKENVVNQFALELHLRHQHSKFHCPECKTNFETWDELYTHTNTDHPTTLKPFLCHLCPKRYGTYVSLQTHTRTLHEVAAPKTKARPYTRHPRVDINAKCKQCDRTFTNASCLASHVRLIHPTEDQKTCKYCLQKFETMAQLMTHLRVSHMMDKEHMCDQCPKTFAYERQLVSHQNREHGVPFPDNFSDPQRQCEDCGKVFCRGKSLRLHRLTIHGNPEKNYGCPREGCSFRAVTEYEVKKHVLYVHDKVPRPKKTKVPCPECDKWFSGNYCRDIHLKNIHGRTDITVKEYKLSCTQCDKTFSSKRYYLSHLNRVHGENHDLSMFTTPIRRTKPRPSTKRKRKPKARSDSEESSEEQVVEEYPGQYYM